MGQIRQIEPYQLGLRRPFPVVVDVREEEQLVLGHIDGAKRISPDSLKKSIRDVVPDLATPIVVYCAAIDAPQWLTSTLREAWTHMERWRRILLFLWLKARPLSGLEVPSRRGNS